MQVRLGSKRLLNTVNVFDLIWFIRPLIRKDFNNFQFIYSDIVVYRPVKINKQQKMNLKFSICLLSVVSVVFKKSKISRGWYNAKCSIFNFWRYWTETKILFQSETATPADFDHFDFDHFENDMKLGLIDMAFGDHHHGLVFRLDPDET